MNIPKADVYRNLNKPGVTYSVRVDGRVRDYRNRVILHTCRMVHATAKQLVAVRTGRRQVCQWLHGQIAIAAPEGPWRRLAVDPKKFDGFVDFETKERVDRALWVDCRDDGSVWYVGGQTKS